MNRKFGTDYTIGSIPRHLLAFSLPVLIGSLVQTSYNIINAIWVGRLLGGDAVGSITVVFPVILIMVALTSGIATSASILTAKNYGAGQNDTIQRVVNVAWTFSFILILFVVSTGLLSSDFILKLLGTPASTLQYASGYLRIIFISFCTMNISTLIISILRGVGDTKTPTLFLLLSTIVNAILDPVLIIGIGPFPRLGLNGAAVASLIAGLSATAAGIIYLVKKYGNLPVRPRKLNFDIKILKELINIGLPIFLQQTILSLGVGFVTVFVNSFGAAATAAFGVATRVEMLLTMPALSVFSAVSTLTAQNLGAAKKERIPHIFKWGIVLSTSIISFVVLLVVIFSNQIMAIFITDIAIKQIGTSYLRTVCPAYLIVAISYVANGIINGSGKTIVTMLFSLFTMSLVRIPLAWILSRSFGLNGIWYGIVISFFITMVLNLTYYFIGGWQKKQRNLESETVC